jgi:dUTP pyrophosphatase
MNNLKIRILDESAIAPIRAHATDAGLDLSSCQEYIIYPDEMKVVSTGIAIALDQGYVGLVFSRSGMGKVRVNLANAVGVIDANYRGEIKVMVQNEGTEPFRISKYDRIAQLVITPIVTPSVELFTGPLEEWNNTDRGTSGFGSSGFSAVETSRA